MRCTVCFVAVLASGLLEPVVGFEPRAAAQPAPSLSDLLTRKLRGGYASFADTAVVAPAAQAGINTLFVEFRLRHPDPETVAQIERWAGLCRAHGIGFWPVVHYYGEIETTWIGDFRRYVDANGTLQRKTPCPLDESFWRRAVETRFLTIAEVSRREPLMGVVLDTEMYAADFTLYREPCYCGECVARTLRRAGRDIPLPLSGAPGSWLTQQGLGDAHREECRRAVQSLAEQTRGRVLRIAPEFAFAAFNADQASPMLDGLMLGFGRPERPALALAEVTFVTGATPPVPENMQKRMARLQGHALLVPGIWQSRFTPQALAAHLYHSAMYSSGYWVYTFETFTRPTYCPLPGPPDEFWAAIQTANRELDAVLADPQHGTTLRLEPFRLPRPEVTTDGVDAAWHSASPVVGNGSAVDVELRGRNIIYARARSGAHDGLSIHFLPFEFSPDGGAYLHVGPDRRVATRGTWTEPVKAAEVPIALEARGVHALVVDVGDSACRIEGTCPFALSATKAAPARLFRNVPALYVAALAGARDIVVRLEPQYGGQAIEAVFTVGDAIASRATITKAQELSVAIPRAAQIQIVKIELRLAAGHPPLDIALAVLGGAYPLVASSPAGLLRRD